MSNLIWTLRAMFARGRQRLARRRNRLKAIKSTAKSIPSEFTFFPEPRSIGSYETGEALLGHSYFFAGKMVEESAETIWDIDAPSPAFEEDVQSFVWLDDLAAHGNKEARIAAQQWVRQWITRFGTGRYGGWTPPIVGARVMRICSHARFLFRRLDQTSRDHILSMLAKQSKYLAESWDSADTELGKLQALTGRIYFNTSFSGYEKELNNANKSMGTLAAKLIDGDGEITSRNPEELMEVFALLIWSARTMEDAKIHPDPRILNAIERVAPTLRSLRLGDGSLTRFHGGGRGRPGRLDQLLSDSRVRRSRGENLAMGYERLTAGRMTLLMDCGRPPPLKASAHAHASTLAFELSSGRFPILANCGAGQKFGTEWERLCRTSGAHNVAVVGGISSSTIEKASFVSRTFGERLLTEPTKVSTERKIDTQTSGITASHDGYVPMFGVLQDREISFSVDGKTLLGKETLTPSNAKRPKSASNFTARFHLHPTIIAKALADGKSFSLILPNKETWSFTSDAHVSLEESVYLDQWSLKPLSTKQIVVSSAIVEYGGQINWTMTRVSEAERPKFAVRETSATT